MDNNSLEFLGLFNFNFGLSSLLYEAHRTALRHSASVVIATACNLIMSNIWHWDHFCTFCVNKAFGDRGGRDVPANATSKVQIIDV